MRSHLRASVKYDSSTHEDSCSMFLHRLMSFSSSFCPRRRPGLCQATSRSAVAFSSNLQQSVPASHPWWSVQGFPPWPPRLLRPRPPAGLFFAGRTFQPFNLSCGRSLHVSAGRTMQCPDRAYPNKRLKDREEKGGGVGGAPREMRGKAEEGESKRDCSLRPNHHFRAGNHEETKSRGERSASRDKHVERTKDEKKGSGNDQHSTQTLESKPVPDQVPEHKANPWFKRKAEEELCHKPNPWFKGRGPHWKETGPAPAEQLTDGSVGAAKWTGLKSNPPSTSQTLNVWHRVHRPPPSPWIHLPVKRLQRQWETCSAEAQPPGGSAAFDFSVMSYNILSQELLQDNAHLYRHCEPGVLPWDYRLPNLLAEIQQLNADILCLQEVQEDHYENQIKPVLQAHGYQCEFKKRTGKKPDGCAVIFKASRFSLLASSPVEFFRPGDVLLDRDNVGLVVLLQPNHLVGQSDSSSLICVANSHLLCNPRRGDVKLAQLAILLAEVGRLSRLPNGSTCPVVFCGDLNSVPGSPLYTFLTTGCLDYRGMQISTVSGQETSSRSKRLLKSPIWSPSLGISSECQYESKGSDESSPISPTGGISNLTVEDLKKKAAAVNSWKIEHSLNLQSSYRHHLMPDGRPEITTCHSRT
ncbi:protein angel homolog 2, partial [Austrofundulus limnaeus]|uniref:Protein angel homolog 2 n=1 Tax=Austrofundulus limnaeus TaxID=52670 RepID=A0A2I4AKY3_AUSLI